jgi:transposase
MSTSLLYHAFGIKGVKYISTKYKNGTTIFHSEVTNSIECCPECKSCNTKRKKGMKVREFKMTPIGSRQTFLRIKIWRLYCDDCQSLRWPNLPFSEGKKRYTRRFAKFAIDLLHWMTISGTANLLNVGWDLIKDIHKDHLKRRYKSPPLENLEYLGIDEFSLRKGHNYMSIFVDLKSGRILHAVEGRSGKDIEPFLKRIKKRSPKLKAIAMDMSKSYIAAVQEHLPLVPIVFDHYHISALMNNAIEDVRREQQAQIDQEGEKLIKGSRFLLLKNYENLSCEKQDRLNDLLRANEPLFTAHTMKEQLRQFWEKDTHFEAALFLDAWCTDAEKSGIKALKKVAKTLMQHSHGLLNYFFHRITSAQVEGINNKIKTLKRQAYGFRDMVYFKLRLYHLHSQAYSLTG